MPQQKNPAPIPEAAQCAFDCLYTAQSYTSLYGQKRAHLAPSMQQSQPLKVAGSNLGLIQDFNTKMGNGFSQAGIFETMRTFHRFKSQTWQIQLLRAQYFVGLAQSYFLDSLKDASLTPFQKKHIELAVGMTRLLNIDKMVGQWVKPFHHKEYRRIALCEVKLLAEELLEKANTQVAEAQNFARRMAWEVK